MDINSSMHQQILVSIVYDALGIIRNKIGGHLPPGNTEIKDNKTLVTAVDREVQGYIIPILRATFPNTKINAEEDDVEIGEGKIRFLVDPLDGTRAFSSGLATSTVIVGVYDEEKKEVTGCVIGEASTKRVWYAFGDNPTELFGHGRVSVWPKPIDSQCSVFLDVSHGFEREKVGVSGKYKQQIFTDKQLAKIFGMLNGQVKIQIPGSNGLIQSLVANGGQLVAGSITTAIGGPFDVCGAKLVKNAGGHIRSFFVYPWDGDFRGLPEGNPLDVVSMSGYDLLITGNSKETADFLSGVLLEVYQNHP